MADVTLDGYFGMGNAGDDAFCAVTAAVARGHWTDKTVGVLAPQGSLPAHVDHLPAVLPGRPKFRGHTRLTSAKAVIQSGDVLHVGGSTLSKMNRHFSDQQLLSRMGLVRLHAAAVGIGPFATTNDGAQIKSFLEQFETVSVRDNASMDRLEELGLGDRAIRVNDIAVLVPELFDIPVSTHPEGEPPLLAVSACSFEKLYGTNNEADEDQRNRELVSLLRDVVDRTGARVRFIIFNSHPRWGDEATCAMLAAQLSDKTEVTVEPYAGDILQVFSSLSECDGLIGMRLHSAIFAHSIGVPFSVVSYHKKCSDFAADVGLADQLVLPRVGIAPDSVDAIVDMLDPTRTTAAPDTAEMTSGAWKAFEHLPWHRR